MKGHQADHPIATMGRVLGVSPSGYYAWQHRAPSARTQRDAALTMTIHTIHLESRGTYGAPRVHAELAAQGIAVGRKRVARLMRRAQLRGVSRRKWITTTTRDPDATPFLAFLASGEAAALFEAEGFTMLAPPPAVSN